MEKVIKKKIIKKGIISLILVTVVIFTYITLGNGNFLVDSKVQKKVPIYSVETSEKKISFTFDISWGLDNVEEILDVLDEYNVKATFFVVGGWIDYDLKNAEMVKEIHKRGHEIGNHSNMHPDMSKISKDRIIKELEATSAKIKNITNEDVKLFRCPSGAYNNLLIDTAQGLNYYVIQWDVDSIDWKSEGPEIEYNRVIDKTKAGSILLFHNDAKYTPKNIPRVIQYFKSKGYEIVKVGDLIYKENYKIDSLGVQKLMNQ